MCEFAFITLDPQNRVVGWSKGAERLFGYCEAEIIGRCGKVLFTQEAVERDEPTQELQTAMEQGRLEGERWYVRKNGSPFWGRGVVTVLRTRSDELRGYAKLVFDYTEKRTRVYHS